MLKRSLGSRVLATTLIAGALGVGGLATGTSAFAADNDPAPPSGGCTDRQVTDHNGYTFYCDHGTWKYWRLGAPVPTANRAQDPTTTKPVKPAGVGQLPAAPPRA